MIRLLIIILLISASICSAQNNYIELGSAYLYQKSNLAVDSKNEIIHNYSEPDDAFGKFIPVVRFNYSQNKNGTGFYIGSPSLSSSGGGFLIGLKKPGLLNTEFSVYLSYRLPEEVWEDPFLLNKERSSTYKDSYGFGLNLNNILNTRFSYKLKLLSENIRDDVIGSNYSRLQRDGYIISQEISKNIRMSNKMFLNLGIFYKKGEYEGDANSYDEPGISASWAYLSPKGLSARIIYSLSYAKYAKEHPLFDKTRKDVNENIILVLRKNNILNLKNVFASAYIGVGGSFSNIDFYEKRLAFTGMSAGYSF
ncbi:surface lipoprotein assembly modifier [Flexistipes sp.]|uniref:surface lipoprotein assembly modifier n=1 Tax=Flexistipes sp. TaxID=3088135 RepID=UPI002E23D137|nr:DUF2860 family protein [Flexistipes sp.]